MQGGDPWTVISYTNATTQLLNNNLQGASINLKKSKWLCRMKVGKSTVSQVYSVLTESKDKVLIISQHDSKPFNIEKGSLLMHL